MRRITNEDIENAAAKIENIIRGIEARDAEIVTRSREAAEKMLTGADPNKMGAEVYALKEARAIAAQALEISRAELAAMKAEKPAFDKEFKAAAAALEKLEAEQAANLSACFNALWDTWRRALSCFVTRNKAEPIVAAFKDDLQLDLTKFGSIYLQEAEKMICWVEAAQLDFIRSAGIPGKDERYKIALDSGIDFKDLYWK
jgi:hypothetical protein